MQKRGQGLPINTIILIAIGLLILVVVVLFVTRGFGSLGGATSTTSSSAATAFYGECQNLCQSAASANNVPVSYCTTTDTLTGPSGKSVLYTCSNITAVTGGNTGCTLNNGTTFYSYSGTNGQLSCSSSCNGNIACK